MAVRGIGASFKIGDSGSPASLTDISTYLDNIGGTSDVERLDGTCFQPGVTNPLKTELSGFRTRGFTLSIKWSAAAEVFFSALEGAEGVDYEYGPDGTSSGKKKITGACNVLNYSGPSQGISGVVTATCDISVTSRTVGTFS